MCPCCLLHFLPVISLRVDTGDFRPPSPKRRTVCYTVICKWFYPFNDNEFKIILNRGLEISSLCQENFHLQCFLHIYVSRIQKTKEVLACSYRSLGPLLKQRFVNVKQAEAEVKTFKGSMDPSHHPPQDRSPRYFKK